MNKDNNPWTSPITGKLINPPEIPNTGSKTPKGEDIKNPLNKPLNDIYRGTSNLRFRPNAEENPFRQSINNQVLILPTFPTWKSTDDIYYYNILKNKGLAKRKVTFGQTITTPPSNLLSGKLSRYQTRYQTRNNNSLEKSSDDDDDDNDNSNQENNPKSLTKSTT